MKQPQKKIVDLRTYFCVVFQVPQQRRVRKDGPSENGEP